MTDDTRARLRDEMAMAEYCPRCGDFLIYTDGRGFYRALNGFSLSERKRLKRCQHDCKLAYSMLAAREEGSR